MHQPSVKPGQRQKVETVISDLKSQQARLADAVAWTESVAKGVKACGQQIQFTNVEAIPIASKQVGIALSLPAKGVFQDVPVFTLYCVPSEADLRSWGTQDALRMEMLRVETMLQWRKQGVQVFETMLVDANSIWQGSPEATQVFLVRQVKEWLTYWFENPPKPIYRQPVKSINLATKVR